MLYKTTTKLYKGIYPYKIVVLSAIASSFRGNLIDIIYQNLLRVKVVPTGKPMMLGHRNLAKTQDELDYAFKLYNTIKDLTGIDIRVESPYLTIYTCDQTHVDKLVKLDHDRIKYISVPPKDTVLDGNSIISPKRDFDYKVTLGRTNTNHSAFITWAENSSNLKMTKSCKSALSKDRSWGGAHFYVRGEKNLLMAKMHLGGSIAKVEQIVKKKP